MSTPRKTDTTPGMAFERPIHELESQLAELEELSKTTKLDIGDEVEADLSGRPLDELKGARRQVHPGHGLFHYFEKKAAGPRLGGVTFEHDRTAGGECGYGIPAGHGKGEGKI